MQISTHLKRADALREHLRDVPHDFVLKQREIAVRVAKLTEVVSCSSTLREIEAAQAERREIDEAVGVWMSGLKPLVTGGAEGVVSLLMSSPAFRGGDNVDRFPMSTPSPFSSSGGRGGSRSTDDTTGLLERLSRSLRDRDRLLQDGSEDSSGGLKMEGLSSSESSVLSEVKSPSSTDLTHGRIELLPSSPGSDVSPARYNRGTIATSARIHRTGSVDIVLGTPARMALLTGVDGIEDIDDVGIDDDNGDDGDFGVGSVDLDASILRRQGDALDAALRRSFSG